ncbi:hypothetical protein CO676_04495 [Sinorhizobium sp. BJ1]|jgi:hypothetical protein|nr:hypothetical protein CO676_04495 [Sinorhizobium sp. BJ1]
MAGLPFKILLAFATALTAAPGVSVSQDFDVYIGGGYVPRYYDEYRPRRYYREDYPREAYQCTERQALYISRQYLRKPRIGRTTRHSIEVKGIGRRGERNRVIFGAEPGCPRID